MNYPLEDIRDFFVKRSFLCQTSFEVMPYMISKEEYTQLKARNLVVTFYRESQLRAFMDGWICAK